MKTIKLSEDDWLLRLDPGDEINSSLVEFAKSHDIKAATYTGIGAVAGLKYGYFDLNTKQYQVSTETISLEIVNLTGNITRLDGEPIAHTHISVGFPDMTIKGGHLMEGVISVTGEIGIRTYDTVVIRGKSQQFGLNLIQ